MTREHRYYIYIMSSRTGVLYIGVTSNIEFRVQQHKNGAYEGFTKKYKCHRLVYYEVYDHIQTAIGREKQLKGWTRARKIALIQSTNPRWRDLSTLWQQEMLLPGQSIKEADDARARRIKLQVDAPRPKSQTSSIQLPTSSGDPSAKIGPQDDSV